MSLLNRAAIPLSHTRRNVVPVSLLASRTLATQAKTKTKSTASRSTDAERKAASAPSQTPRDASSKVPPKPTGASLLTWPEYLNIRKSRRRWEAVATVPAGFVGFGSGIAYFGNLETDPLKLIFGFDPFLVYGFLTVGCLGLGVLTGPTIGGALWRFTHRHQVHLIDERDRQFLHRIAKNRVDAALQSPTAPVPDYYGERVGSLHQYRQWLRDQGKYRRKALLPEKED